MAECKICGHIDNGLPESWINWTCDLCDKDQGRTVSGYWDLKNENEPYQVSAEVAAIAREDGVCPFCDRILRIADRRFECPDCQVDF